MGLAGSDDHRSDRAVIVGFFSTLVFDARTALAMDFLRGVVPRAIQRDGDGVVDGPIAFQHPFLAEGLEHLVIQGAEFFGRNRIQSLADVIVGGNLFDVEEALRVAPSLGLLHGFLMGQERRRLREENREGAQTDVLHRELGIIAGAPVGQSAQNLARLGGQRIPVVHKPSLPRQSGRSGLT